MLNLIQLRLIARESFVEALRAVDVGTAVRRAVQLAESRIKIGDFSIEIPDSKPVYVISIGKAGFRMAISLEEILGGRVASGVVSSIAPNRRADRNEKAKLSDTWCLFQGGHPEPNDESLLAAQACFDL